MKIVNCPKYFRTNENGKKEVAVLYSPGYGAGWYSWASEYPQILFDPDVVEIVLNVGKGGWIDVDRIIKILSIKYPDADDEEHPCFYVGGAKDLTVKFLPIGTLFKIEEYDGSESIEISEGTEGYILAGDSAGESFDQVAKYVKELADSASVEQLKDLIEFLQSRML